MANAFLVRLQNEADDLRSTMDQVLTRAADDGRSDLTESETANFNEAETRLRALTERIEELSELELRAAASADLARKVADATDGKDFSPVIRVGEEPRTYSEATPERSFFQDLVAEARGDHDAHERLERHYRENTVERANTVASLPEFAPPAYLVNDYAPLVRSGRPVANAIGSRPASAKTMYTPKLTQGTAVGVQAAEGDTLAIQDFDASNITTVLQTVGGYADISQDLVDWDQGVAFDREVFADLARAHSVWIEDLVLNSTTTNCKGILSVSGSNAVTFTSGSPTVALLYSKVAGASSAIHTARKDTPQVIIMHPRRWDWIKAASDTTGRPLYSPVAPTNNPGTLGPDAAQGFVGEFYGLPVVTSHAIPTNLGTGTNQDPVIVARLDDLRLFETATKPVVDAVSLAYKRVLRFSLSGYAGIGCDRFPESISVINGTGLVAPTF